MHSSKRRRQPPLNQSVQHDGGTTSLSLLPCWLSPSRAGIAKPGPPGPSLLLQLLIGWRGLGRSGTVWTWLGIFFTRVQSTVWKHTQANEWEKGLVQSIYSGNMGDSWYQYNEYRQTSEMCCWQTESRFSCTVTKVDVSSYNIHTRVRNSPPYCATFLLPSPHHCSSHTSKLWKYAVSKNQTWNKMKRVVMLAGLSFYPHCKPYSSSFLAMVWHWFWCSTLRLLFHADYADASYQISLKYFSRIKFKIHFYTCSVGRSATDHSPSDFTALFNMVLLFITCLIDTSPVLIAVIHLQSACSSLLPSLRIFLQVFSALELPSASSAAPCSIGM